MARSVLGKEKVYEAFSAWRNECLIADRSMFNEGEELWTLNNIQQLVSLVEGIHQGRRNKNTLEKLKEQLKSVSPEIAWLAAEIIWVLFLFPRRKAPNEKWKQILSINPETKRNRYIKEVYECSGKNLPDSPYLRVELLSGIARAGRRLNSNRYDELVFLLRVLKKWKTELQENNLTFEDEDAHWNFAKSLDEAYEDADDYQIRHTILHLLFPDYFETASNKTHKEAFFNHYRSKYKLSEELLSLPKLDHALYKLRTLMEEKYGYRKNFHWYDPEILKEWHSNYDKKNTPERRGFPRHNF